MPRVGLLCQDLSKSVLSIGLLSSAMNLCIIPPIGRPLNPYGSSTHNNKKGLSKGGKWYNRDRLNGIACVVHYGNLLGGRNPCKPVASAASRYIIEPVSHVYRRRRESGAIYCVRQKPPQRVLLVHRTRRSRFGALLRASPGSGTVGSESQHGGQPKVRQGSRVVAPVSRFTSSGAVRRPSRSPRRSRRNGPWRHSFPHRRH
jgi:hypothetical protein